MPTNEKVHTNRRGFLGSIASTAAAVTLAPLMPLQARAAEQLDATNNYAEVETMFKRLKGKHRIAFDVTQPHEIFPFAWPRVFLMTNEMTGTMTKDSNVVVVLRHSAIPYAFEDRLWEKYSFGEVFKANDPRTKQGATRNPFWQPAKGDFNIPGIGQVAIGINELQESGVKFCVCDAAITVNSNIVAGKMNLNPADVRADWMSGLLPGMLIVPSGVWALGRAQENGCGYIFAG